jgi:hypothetical protein
MRYPNPNHNPSLTLKPQRFDTVQFRVRLSSEDEESGERSLHCELEMLLSFAVAKMKIQVGIARTATSPNNIHPSS